MNHSIYFFHHLIDLFSCSVTKTKILDASGPPGFPSLLPGGSNRVVSAVISVLSFSPDGEVRYINFLCLSKMC